MLLLTTCSLYKSFTSLLNKISSITPKLACLLMRRPNCWITVEKHEFYQSFVLLITPTPLEPRLALAVAQKITSFAGEARSFPSRASSWRILCSHRQFKMHTCMHDAASLALQAWCRRVPRPLTLAQLFAHTKRVRVGTGLDTEQYRYRFP